MGKFAGWWQKFSATRYAPYVRWWFSPRTNLVFLVGAGIGLAIFYLASKP